MFRTVIIEVVVRDEVTSDEVTNAIDAALFSGESFSVEHMHSVRRVDTYVTEEAC